MDSMTETAEHEAATERACLRRDRGRFVYRYTTTCACGWSSRPKAQKWAVEDDHAAHIEAAASPSVTA